jgi:succinoglycan biosynthesis transport protein ExoP
MELERYAKVIWKWLWLILLAAGVAGVSSYFATRSAPRIYQTKTTVMIGRFIQDPNPDSGDFYTSQQLGQTYAQLVRRQPVLQGALEALDLADQMRWSALADNVTVALVPGTQLMEIRVNDTSPQRAKALADAIAQQLILQSPSNPGADQEDRRAFAQEQLDSLEIKINEAEAEIEKLQVELDEAISARRIQDLQTQIDTIQNKVSSWQSSYAQFLTFLEGGDVNYLAVVEQALVPITPIAPKVGTSMLLAVAIGATLAVGGAFLLEFMDDTIKTSDDIERISSLPMLGSISRIREEDSEGMPIAARLPSALAVESYRALRTNLQLSSGTLSRSSEGKPTRTLVVTSSDRLEGKSTTASNLAVVMAQSGLSTILVDADLRRPVLHQKFDLTTVGLTEALLETSSLAGKEVVTPAVWEYLQETPVENLRVMTGGHLPPNPAELLGSAQMRRLIRALEAEADIVLFDTPPAAVVTDAVVLAAQVDGVVLVVSSGGTRRAMLRRTIEALERAGTPIIGVVLNRVTDRSDGYYYPRRYGSLDEPGRTAERQEGNLVARIPFLRFFTRDGARGRGAPNGG